MKKVFFLLLLCLNCAFLSAQCVPGSTTLASTAIANNGQRGQMFNIVATNNIIVHCFSPELYSGVYGTYCIYYRLGSHVGHQNSAASWTFIDSVQNLIGTIDEETLIPINVNISIPAGDTVAFYITCRGTTPSYGGLRYYGHSAAPAGPVDSTWMQDANMKLLVGIGKDYPFFTNYGARAYIGAVHYSLAQPTVSAFTPTAGCIGTTTVTIKGSSFTNATAVTIGGTAVSSFTVNADTQITAIVGNGTTGTIAVTNPLGIGTSTGIFSVSPAPPANAIPTISASNLNPCANTQITLTANPPTGYTAAEYLWYKNGVPINYQNGGNGTYTVNAGTTAATHNYSLKIVYSSYYCLSNTSATTTLTTHAPQATITPAGPTTFCANNPTTLNATTNMTTYVWKYGTTTVGTNSNSYVPIASGNHRVIVTDANGCSKSSAWINITRNLLPTANAGLDRNVCDGSSVQIGGTNNIINSYSWSPSVGLSNPAVSNPTATPSSSLLYNVYVTNNITGCSNTDQVAVNVLTLPATPSVTKTVNGNIATLTPNAPGVTLVNWYRDGLSLYANMSATLPLNVTLSNPAKSYTIRSKAANGCLSLPSAAINARNNGLLSENLTLSAYPNPATNELNINIQSTDITTTTLYITNTLGQIVEQKEISLENGKTNLILDIHQLAAGVYSLTIENKTIKMIKE